MLTIQARAYAGEADIQAIVDLQAAARTIEPQLDPFTIDNLRDEYNEPAFDLKRDLRLWEAGGKLVMFAEARVGSTCSARAVATAGVAWDAPCCWPGFACSSRPAWTTPSWVSTPKIRAAPCGCTSRWALGESAPG